MRKRILVFMLLFAAAAPAQSLTVLYMVQAGYDPLDVVKRGDEFTSETGIAVEFRFEEYDDIYDIVTGHEGEQGAFDIVLLDTIWTADFAVRNILEPVPLRMREKVEGGMIPQLSNANMFDGTMWGVPFLANFQLLYTNMDLLREAGYTRAPRTLAEMRDMAFRAKELGVIEYPIFESLRPEEILMCELVWLSGTFGNEWSQQSQRIEFDTPENRKAAAYLLGLLEAGLLNPYSLSSGEMFAADVFEYGDALFTTNWTFLIGRLQDRGGESAFEFDVSVIPSEIEGRESSTVSGYQGLAVMKNSDQKEAAWDFIMFLSSPQFQSRYLDEFPVWKEVWADESIVAKDPFFAVKRQQVEGAKVRYMHPLYRQISDTVINTMHRALRGEVSLDQAFALIEDKLREMQL
jgi:multiple sugar transport system substrate-binding protein